MICDRRPPANVFKRGSLEGWSRHHGGSHAPGSDIAVLKVDGLSSPAIDTSVILHPETVETALPARGAGNVHDVPLEALTSREMEVLALIADGLSNKQIAERLKISDHTVKFHVASMMGKLGAASRTEAVTAAIRRGILLV